MELWEMVARERIRDSLAQYNWSGDALRLDDMAAAFSPDGVLELRGGQQMKGREAIVAFLGGVNTTTAPSSAEPTPAEPTPAEPTPAESASPSEPASPAVRRIVRHILTNTRFLELTPERAKVASYFTVVTEIGLDHYGRYRDEFVPVGDEWLIAHRFVSTDWRATDSTMAPRSSVG